MQRKEGINYYHCSGKRIMIDYSTDNGRFCDTDNDRFHVQKQMQGLTKDHVQSKYVPDLFTILIEIR